MTIKCVFFDFDDVLRTWEYQLDGIEEEFGITLQAFRDVAFDPGNLTPAIRGDITDEQWRGNVRDILIEKFRDRDVLGAWNRWSNRHGVLIPEVREIIEACMDSVEIGMMSNATSRLNSDLQHHGLDGLFDYVVNTSEVGAIKPEPEIYQHALKVAGVEPAEAMFIDDKARNVDAAVTLGWHGHVFKDPAGLRAALVDAGVL